MKYSVSLVACVLAGATQAHTWVELANIIAPNGTMVGEPGYPRGNVLRSNPAFNDGQMTWLLPPNGRSGPNPNAILPTDLMCKPSQAIGNQTQGSPALIASPGDMVALRYQENGHVTLPATQAGKPKNRGTVYIYGTTSPSNSDTLLSIHHVWTADGSGGNGKGVLLATRNFDDGQCYQVNGGDLSVTRQAQFQHEAVEPMGVNIWCQTDVTIPSTAPTNGAYTLYWVWEWPTAAGTPGFPDGKNETYTTCLDIDMQANTNSKISLTDTSKNVKFSKNQDLNFAAIGDQLTNAFLAGTGSAGTAPQATGAASSSAPGGIFAEPSTTGSLNDGPVTVTATVSVPVTQYITVTAGAQSSTPSSKSKTKTKTKTKSPSQSPVPLAESAGSIVVPSASSTPLNVQPFTIGSMIPTESTTLSIIAATYQSTFQTRISTTTPVVTSSPSPVIAPSTTESHATITDVKTKTVISTRYSNSTATAAATLRGRYVRVGHAHLH